jgi:hypothetical protein
MEDLFGRWWTPSELIAACENIRLSVTSRDFRHSDEVKHVREALAAAKFAELRPWNLDWEVSLTPKVEEFPDFKLRSNSDVRWFEEVEARHPRLERGNHEFSGWTHENPEEHFRAGMEVTAERIATKAAKRYRPRPHLLVYCNFWSGEVLKHEANRIIAPYRDGFLSVWLLFWGQNAIQLWPDPCKVKPRQPVALTGG